MFVVVKPGNKLVMYQQMPLLDHTKLVGYKQQRLAHMCLTFIGGAYVWQDGEKGVATVTSQHCC